MTYRDEMNRMIGLVTELTNQVRFMAEKQTLLQHHCNVLTAAVGHLAGKQDGIDGKEFAKRLLGIRNEEMQQRLVEIEQKDPGLAAKISEILNLQLDVDLD